MLLLHQLAFVFLLLLYDILGLESPDKKAPRGTGEDILKHFAQGKEKNLCEAILGMRNVEKLLGTYIDKMPEISLEDGVAEVVVSPSDFEKAKEILAMCKKHFMTSYDESGSIGKRYRRADAIGTPWQISVDEKTVEENIVTLRDRDTMEQIELKVEELVPYIEERIQFEK